MNETVILSDEVREAVANQRPVVALETTVVTHGLPEPVGLEVAAKLEDAARLAGAVPATIGLLDGRIRVGLTNLEVERLSRQRPIKVNLSNLASTLVAKAAGSTTVAATLVAARAAGIRVMATGGIGGVHRGASESGDISADLIALASNPVAVVCAGAKAVLDLPRSLEALETAGVPVIGFKTGAFLAFYRRDSGLPVDARVDTVEELAEIVRLHSALRVDSGVLVANPVPQSDELPLDLYNRAIEEALTQADRKGVAGRDVTPFLLGQLDQRTEGRAVACNRALLDSNVRLGAGLAVALARSIKS